MSSFVGKAAGKGRGDAGAPSKVLSLHGEKVAAHPERVASAIARGVVSVVLGCCQAHPQLRFRCVAQTPRQPVRFALSLRFCLIG